MTKNVIVKSSFIPPNGFYLNKDERRDNLYKSLALVFSIVQSIFSILIYLYPI